MHRRASTPPRLVAVSHGTASTSGSVTTARLVQAVTAARPDIAVDVCFLDVAAPRLPEMLADLNAAPAVVVPVLLSTGYHVQSDIPAAAAGYPRVRVARHLGPHPLLVDALADRLGSRPSGSPVALVGAGSTRADARDELDETARLLTRRIAAPVTVHTVGPELAGELSELPRPLRVATYLLAEGQFADRVRAAAGGAEVAPVLGTHPSLVELIWTRYDETVGRGPLE